MVRELTPWATQPNLTHTDARTPDLDAAVEVKPILLFGALPVQRGHELPRGLDLRPMSGANQPKDDVEAEVAPEANPKVQTANSSVTDNAHSSSEGLIESGQTPTENQTEIIHPSFLQEPSVTPADAEKDQSAVLPPLLP